jgi:hypothetical protein
LRSGRKRRGGWELTLYVRKEGYYAVLPEEPSKRDIKWWDKYGGEAVAATAEILSRFDRR